MPTAIATTGQVAVISDIFATLDATPITGATAGNKFFAPSYRGYIVSI